jgi:hypothetical protein
MWQARRLREAVLELGSISVVRGIIAFDARMGVPSYHTGVESGLPFAPKCPLLQCERERLIVDESQGKNIGIVVCSGIEVANEIVRPTTVVCEACARPVEVVPDRVYRLEGQICRLTTRLSDPGFTRLNRRHFISIIYLPLGSPELRPALARTDC